jgi:hypothetical protein
MIEKKPPSHPSSLCTRDSEFIVDYHPWLIATCALAWIVGWAVLLMLPFWKLFDSGLSIQSLILRVCIVVVPTLLGPVALRKYMLESKVTESGVQVRYLYRFRQSIYPVSEIVRVVRTTKRKELDKISIECRDGKTFRFNALARNYQQLVLFLSQRTGVIDGT